MQISSVNAGFISGPGPSVALPTARKPAAGPSASAHVDVSSAVNVRALPQITSPATDSSASLANADASRALVLARQYEGMNGLSGNAQAGGPGSAAAAQRAVMAYNNVATQEQRFELTGILVGIDVFA